LKRQKRRFPWVAVLAAAYVAAVILAWLLLARFADRWWPVSILMFGPRWVLLLPAIILVPVALVARRWRSLLAVVMALVVVLWPVMGWNWAGLAANDREQRDLRLVTFNIGNSRVDEHRVTVEDLRRLYDISRSDLLLLQECSFGKDELFPFFPDAQIYAADEACLLSRWPIIRTDVRPRDDLQSLGANGSIVSFDIDAPHGKFTVVNIHLATQRSGLERVLSRSTTGGDAMRIAMFARRLDSAAAFNWSLRSPLPQVVVGDFNMPVESAFYKERWRGYGNAFSDCGLGYGYTKYEKRYGIRIDHVLYDRAWRCLTAQVDPGLGGDHRPVIADLRLRR
jgi:vancomycin resistance protein VanJ